jgi:hypothetical protein
MLPTYNSSPIAKPLEQYQFPIDEQIRIEQQIQHDLENAPSMYSDKVSKKARDAWEERLFQNIESHRHYQVRDQAGIVSDRPGRSIHIRQFVRMLNTLPRRRWMLNSWSIRGMRGLSVSRGGSRPAYVCALDDPVMPEWSKLELDEHNLPKRLVSRGWRAVILTLLDQGLVTEHEIQRLFGFAGGMVGQLYRKYLFEHRARKLATGEDYRERVRLRLHEGN